MVMFMSKVMVDFSIETEDQTQAFETEGVVLGNSLIFHDEKSQKHTIDFDGEKMRYLRGGDPAFDFTFEDNVQHVGTYQVGNQTLRFDIQTHKLIIQQNKIELTYTLKQGDIVVNHSALILKYEKMQEA